MLDDINNLLDITSLETLDNNISNNKPTQFINNQLSKIDLVNNKSNINNY